MPTQVPYVMDVGMYDGADTDYYLSSGYSVVGVEANPEFASAATQRFQREIERGALIIEQVAVGEREGTVVLHLSAKDPGSGSTRSERVASGHQAGALTVPCVTIESLLHKHGIPHYLKCDIEGSDRYCILGLDPEHRPEYVSFEMGPDAVELAGHLRRLGYSRFKIINQLDFNPLSYFDSPMHIVRDKVRRTLRRPPKEFIRLGGRLFKSGHSSGPMGEGTTGRWLEGDEVMRQWNEFCTRYGPGSGGWWDMHARRS